MNYGPSTIKDTLFYSLVDISGNQPQIISTQQFTDVPLEEKSLMATKHSNGRDYWLITKRHLTNTFLAFHLKPGGQVDTVYSQAGIASGNGPGFVHHEFKLSPNGQILGQTITSFKDTLQLLHFNTQTGIVSDSNTRYIKDFGYGLFIEHFEFSPNSQYVYAIHESYYPRFFQYDLQSPTQQALMNSKTEIFNNNSQWTEDGMFMTLAANQKIYTYAADSVGHIEEPVYLNSIEYPNKPDTNCRFKPENFLVDSSLYIERKSHYFPKFVSSWLMEPVEISYTHTCLGSDVGGVTHFSFTDSVYKATWHFGDTVTAGPDTSSQLYPSHQYLAPGKYTVWAKALHYGMWDSVSKTITIHQNPQISLGADTMITPNDTLVLDPGPGYADYKWNFGDTTQTYTVYGSQMNPGVTYHYSVEVTDTNGCSGKAGINVYCSGVGIEKEEQEQWKVFPNPANEQLTIELPKAMQEEAVLKLYNPGGAIVRRYEWPRQDKTHRLSLKGLSNGIYWLELDDGRQTLRKKVVKQ
jgi:PKD repeat protein